MLPVSDGKYGRFSDSRAALTAIAPSLQVSSVCRNLMNSHAASGFFEPEVMYQALPPVKLVICPSGPERLSRTGKTRKFMSGATVTSGPDIIHCS